MNGQCKTAFGSSEMVDINGFLLTRQWRDSPKGIELSYWASTDSGPLRISISAQEAVCFIDRQRQMELMSGVRRQPVELKHLRGGPVDALYFKHQRSLNELHGQARWHDLLYESDIKPSDRYLMERFITAAFAARGDVLDKSGYLELQNPLLKRADYVPDFKIATIDIETQGLHGQLYSIAVSCGTDGRVFMVGGQDDVTRPDYRLQFYPDEYQLLNAFFSWLADSDPDLLIGWNVVNFDLDYLQQACQRLGIGFAFGRGGENARILQPGSHQQAFIARLPGRVALDGIEVLRAGFLGIREFHLGAGRTAIAWRRQTSRWGKRQNRRH